jgi:uncharacterized protein YbbK (DUF523 family)
MKFKIRLGISACLMGEPIRYDGGHKWDPLLAEDLGRFVEYVPVCPEVECGMGVPREPMDLAGDPDCPRLLTNRTGTDLTGQMLSWARKRVAELEKEGLSGFIFKSKSPSCGMRGLKVLGPGGRIVEKGVGLFAGLFNEHFPLLPAEEGDRLHDPELREDFVQRIFVLRMGRLVAEGKGYEAAELYKIYEHLLLEALSLKATVPKHINTLQHIMGYFKRDLSTDEKQVLDAERQPSGKRSSG